MGILGKAKQRQEQVEREAQADFEAAVARAKPPTDAERTWVLPTPEVPDLGLRPPARPRRQGNPFAAAPDVRDGDTEAPAPAPRRASKTAGRTASTKSRRPRS